MIKRARREQDVIPPCDDMDDGVFYKHINKRHLKDLGMSQAIDFSPLFTTGLVEAQRSFHTRCHEIAVPGQHDHTHEED